MRAARQPLHAPSTTRTRRRPSTRRGTAACGSSTPRRSTATGSPRRRLGAALRGRPRDEYVLATKVGRLLVPDDHRRARADTIFADVPDVRARVRLLPRRRDAVGRGQPRADSASTASTCSTSTTPRITSTRPKPERSPHWSASATRASSPGSASAPTTPTVAGPLRRSHRPRLAAARRSLHAARHLRPRRSCSTRATSDGVAVLAAGVFNSGVLANPVAGAAFFYEPVPDDVLARVHRLEATCEDFDVPLAGRCNPVPAPLRGGPLGARRSPHGRRGRRGRWPSSTSGSRTGSGMRSP